ncbi:MAG: Trk system potassium transporter TrkA [Clostridiaceae bacterium]|nr:Trk system potassium transporter TrkA [Clostridiaceae bacterium]
MKIIIVGDGKVGYSLAENLSKEKHDITVIDKDPEALRKANEYLDVLCIKGNGVSAQTLLEAGVKNADILIAVTSSDEKNMVCCLAGKKLGAAHTIARIRDPEYASELSILRDVLELDLVINPEHAVAREISRLLRFPSAIDVEMFARGNVELVEIIATADMPIVNMKLMDVSRKFAPDILIGAVQRGNDVYIPNGSFEIKENDSLYILGKPASVYDFCKLMGKLNQKIKNIMIAGGGRIAYYLAKSLKHYDMKVKIIEENMERCIELSELLSDALIIKGDGTDEALLNSENLCNMDAFVVLTGYDEANLLAALLAKQCNVNKVIAKITRINYPAIIKNMGIDSVVNPKVITSNYIIRYVRGLKNVQGNSVENLYRIVDGQVEAIEFTVKTNSRYLNTPLRELTLADGALVAVIVRKNEVIIPHGDDVIKLQDRIIILTKNKQISDFNEIVIAGGK